MGCARGPGADWTIPPTDRPVEQRFCSVARIEAGKITQVHLYFDTAGLLGQLDVMPGMQAAGGAG